MARVAHQIIQACCLFCIHLLVIETIKPFGSIPLIVVQIEHCQGVQEICQDDECPESDLLDNEDQFPVQKWLQTELVVLGYRQNREDKEGVEGFKSEVEICPVDYDGIESGQWLLRFQFNF